MATFYIQVGFTLCRPIVVDEYVTNVVIATDHGPADACLTAAQWVGCCVEMVTSTRVVAVDV